MSAATRHGCSAASLEVRLSSTGIGFRPFVEARSWAPQEGKMIEDDVVSFAVHLAGDELARDLLAACSDERPDVLVVDAMAAGALCAAERLDVPRAVLVHTRYRYLAEEEGASTWLRRKEHRSGRRLSICSTGRALRWILTLSPRALGCARWSW